MTGLTMTGRSLRKLMCLGLWCCFLAIGALGMPAAGWAQDDKAAAAAAPADAGGAAAAVGAVGGEGGGEKDAEPTGPSRSNYFMWVVESSGLIGLGILLLSFYFIATVVKLFLDMRPDVVAPPEVVTHCNEFIQQRDFRGLYAFVKEVDSFLSRVLAAGISELPSGLAEAREAMDRAGEAETVDMEKRISMLAVLGTLGPMIGLLGTLKGMISSFSVIALSDVTLKASEVAGGISEALILTFEGVLLSVPAIYFFAVFRNRVSHLSVNTMLQADELLRQIAQAARTKVPAQPRPAPTTS